MRWRWRASATWRLRLLRKRRGQVDSSPTTNPHFTGFTCFVTPEAFEQAGDGCELPFACDVAGKIALLDPGLCTFALEASNAQASGAGGEVLVNNIDAWTGTMGCETCTAPAASPDTLALVPPMDWIRDEERLGSELSALLVDVYQARVWTGDQHFVSLAPNVGNLVSTNEVQYAASSLPAASLRVLAVARIWSTIHWWFPYRELAQQPWESVLPSIVADAVAADSEAAYHRALLRLLAKVNDGHAFLLSGADQRPPSGACHLPAVVRTVEAAPTVVSASADSGLKPGDRIVALDGASVATLLTGLASLLLRLVARSALESALDAPDQRRL